ncbi:MAG: hypothetical protein PHW32_00315 [Bacilli bacterium]|nr:hypothetical protein [Bacilli bacterium]MDD4282418.1 hypothetical protein [Bacilli bacterium]MDD4718452.1 hypothetical protein [Bacilli bacterium]
MSKIKINSTLKMNDEVIEKKFMGIIIDNKITYKEDLISVTILLNNDKIKMRRDTEEYCINFEFLNNKKTTCVYNVKKQNMIIYLKVKTNSLVIKDNLIIVDYDLYQQSEIIDKFIFKFEYEVIK